jgi:2-keto-3-deoxy-L-rhamnonate aldolase RhmA
MADAFSLARRLRSGETVYSAWCAIPSPLLTETIAREGFPAAVLDAQHGLWDIASAIGAIGALHHAGAAPLLRVPLNDMALVPRALDLGDRCARVCRRGEVPAARRAQLGPFARDAAAEPHRHGRLLARRE